MLKFFGYRLAHKGGKKGNNRKALLMAAMIGALAMPLGGCQTTKPFTDKEIEDFRKGEEQKRRDREIEDIHKTIPKKGDIERHINKTRSQSLTPAPR